MNRFKKWLMPVAIVCLLLASLVGCSNAPASLGEIFDPSGNPFANRFTDVSDLRTATYVVAASDSVHKFEADYFCDGTDDHVQIQAAIDALPASGGEVFLLDGTYNVEVALALDSHQTLRGCGENTILTTTTVGVDTITATGSDSNEKVGILIADLCVDGSAGGVVTGVGILWTYVDYSKISNTWIVDSNEEGIKLDLCDFNRVAGNHVSGSSNDNIYLYDCYKNTVTANVTEGSGCTGIDIFGGLTIGYSNYNVVVGNIVQNNWEGVMLSHAEDCTVSANVVQGNNSNGITITEGYRNTITGNIIESNDVDGIDSFGAFENLISSNTIRLNGEHGIGLFWSDNNSIVGNVVQANSQTTDNTYDNLQIDEGIGNLIADNHVRMGGEANQPRYGIALIDNDCDRNKIIDNDLYDSGLTAKVYIDPAILASNRDTIGLSVVVPFSDGTEPLDSGYLVDGAGDLARAFLFLPDEVQQVRYLKIYARGLTTETDKMRLEINVNGAADNEVYTTHQTLAPDTPSTSANFAADDVIYWMLNSAQILALSAGDSIEVKVLHEDAGGLDVATNAHFRTVEIGYF